MSIISQRARAPHYGTDQTAHAVGTALRPRPAEFTSGHGMPGGSYRAHAASPPRAARLGHRIAYAFATVSVGIVILTDVVNRYYR